MNTSPQSNPASQPSQSSNPYMGVSGGGETSEPLAQGPYEAHRRLDEPVLPSAAEEVMVDRPQTFTQSTRSQSGSAGAAWPFPDGEDADQPGQASRWLTRAEDEVSRYVAEQPVKAALMAVGAGALAALLLGRGMSRVRRGRRD